MNHRLFKNLYTGGILILYTVIKVKLSVCMRWKNMEVWLQPFITLALN